MNDGHVDKRHAPEDRRRIVLQLTDEGRRITAGAARSVQERLIAGLGKLSGDERRTLADLYEAWLRAAGLDVLPASMFFEPAFSTQGFSK